MRLLGKQQLRDFAEKYPDARSQLELWEAEVEDAKWQTPLDVKARYQQVSLPGNRHAIFNICGNKYRLWVQITYKIGDVVVKKIGTHKEYNKWIIV